MAIAIAARLMVLCITKFSEPKLGGRRYMATIRLVALTVTGAAGVTGLLRDTWPAMLSWPPVDLHAAFGTLLCSLVIVAFRRAADAPLTAADTHALCRQLSRAIYLLLYAVFGAGLLMRMVASSPGSVPWSPDNLRDYFAYGVAALLAVRVLAAFSVRPPPGLQMSQPLAPAEGAAAPR
jgi:hypothetical protein